MSTLQHAIDFIAANGVRNYPLEDRADRVSADGTILPNDIITDLHVWFPETVGGYAYVGGVTVTDTLITVVICAHTGRTLQDNSVPTFRPVASVNIPKPTEPGRVYALAPVAPGTGGWITLGLEAGLVPNGKWAFRNPASSGILPRLAHAYPTDGVTSFGRGSTNNRLTGVVKLTSSDPGFFVVERQFLTINGVETEAVVFRLNEEVQGPQIYGAYPGMCDGTDDLKGCDRIYNFGGAIPDCSGTIRVYVDEIYTDKQTPLLTTSYANTNPDGSEPETEETGHALNFDYDRGLVAVCQAAKPDQAVSGTVDDKLTNCDDCNEDVFDPPLTVVNTCGAFYSGVQCEPFYESGTTFITQGDTIQIDVTLTGTLKFNGESDDVFFIMPAGMSIKQSPAMGNYTKGSSVVFSVPPNALWFTADIGWFCNKENGSGVWYHPASAQKTFNDGVHSYTIPKGNLDNDQTGHMSDLAGAGFNVIDFGSVYTVSQLQTMGFVNTDDLGRKMFSCIPVHVVSGKGSAKLEIICTGIK